MRTFNHRPYLFCSREEGRSCHKGLGFPEVSSTCTYFILVYTLCNLINQTLHSLKCSESFYFFLRTKIANFLCIATKYISDYLSLNLHVPFIVSILRMKWDVRSVLLYFILWISDIYSILQIHSPKLSLCSSLGTYPPNDRVLPL